MTSVMHRAKRLRRRYGATCALRREDGVLSGDDNISPGEPCSSAPEREVVLISDSGDDDQQAFAPVLHETKQAPRPSEARTECAHVARTMSASPGAEKSMQGVPDHVDSAQVHVSRKAEKQAQTEPDADPAGRSMGSIRNVTYLVRPCRRPGSLRRRASGAPAAEASDEATECNSDESDEENDDESDDGEDCDGPWHAASLGKSVQGSSALGNRAKLGKRGRKARSPAADAGHGSLRDEASGETAASARARKADWERRMREKGICEIEDAEMGILGRLFMHPRLLIVGVL